MKCTLLSVLPKLALFSIVSIVEINCQAAGNDNSSVNSISTDQSPVTSSATNSPPLYLSPSTISSSTDGILYPDLSQPQDFARFRKSINQIVKSTDHQLHLYADQIAQIRTQLNQSSSVCYQIIEQAFRTGLQEKWSANMINSNAFMSGDFVNSLISERFTSLGDFFTCFSLNETPFAATNGSVSFGGKYCLARLKTPQLGYYSKSVEKSKFVNVTSYFEQITNNWLVIRNRFPFALGICAPSICSSQELNVLIHKYFEEYLDGIELDIDYCQVQTKTKNVNFGFLLSLSILGFMVVTCILASVLHKFFAFLQTSSNKVHPVASSTLRSKVNFQLVTQLVNCFNVVHSFRCLFRSDADYEQRYVFDLRFIHGLKAIMILVTVFLHTASFMTILLFTKLSIFTRYPSFYYRAQQNLSFFYNAVVRGFLWVDLFFVVSGFLVTYMILLKSKKAPNFISYVAVRWIRLVPSVVAVLCLTIVLSKNGMGPLFHPDLIEPYVKPCYDYWWTHVLFINNFWTIDKMCGPNLWFVAADLQLHVLLYLVLFAYFYKKILAYIISIFLIVSSLLVFFLFNFLNLPGWPRADYPVRFQFPAPLDAIRLFYTSPHTHILAYFFGVIAAIRLIKKKPISSSYPNILALISMAMVYICTFYPINWIETDKNEDNSFVFLLIFGIIFIVIILAQGFTFYYLVLGHGSLLKRFLSTKFLIPIGRLSYGIYLLNPLVSWFNMQQSWDTPRLTVQYLAYSFTAVYFQCFALSIFLYVFFQAPFFNLAHIMIKRNRLFNSAHMTKTSEKTVPKVGFISTTDGRLHDSNNNLNHRVDIDSGENCEEENVQLRSYTTSSVSTSLH